MKEYLSRDQYRLYQMIWQRFDEKGSSLTMEDLKAMFPEEETLQTPELVRTGEMDLNRK